VNARSVLLVARRELLERVRTRAYVLSTAVLVAGVAAAVAAPHVLRTLQRRSDVALAGHVHAAAHASAREVAFGAAILLYVALVFAGSWVASGLVEEKSSRVVEVMLSAVRPEELLAGKLLGIGVVALGQVAAAVAAAVTAGLAAGSLDLPHGIAAAALSVFGWFVLGYALYACAFAIAASLVSRQEDLPAVTTPLNAVMVAAFLTAMTAAERPDGLPARVLSLVPPFSPLLMPVRVAAGGVAAWEPAVAMLLALAAIAAAVRVAGAVYARSALHAGARIPLRAALMR
jgi:ABC-2 type transport system permease protein